MYKSKNIKKVTINGKTVIDMVTKVATTYKSVADAKKIFFAWTHVQNNTPMSHYFKTKRR